MLKKLFGHYNDKEVSLYTLENEFLKVDVSDLGATLVNFIYKEYDRDVVLGFKDAATYLDQHGANMGATIGRCANRIGKGTYTLNGKTYHLTINNGPNTLHSGINNLTSKLFEVVSYSADELRLKSEALAGEDGFNGNLKVEVIYKLEGQDLIFAYEGLADEDSLFNITNHAYFNLEGKHAATILNESLRLYTDRVALVDSDGLSTDEVICTDNTGFDFADFKKIGDNLAIGHPNITLASGLDHNFLYEDKNDPLRASLVFADLRLDVYSDLPDMHVYTANFLDGEVMGKYGDYYGPKSGICFECQYYPNAINYDGFIKPIIKAGVVKKHYIRYRLQKV